jgi:hypothetical protein
VRRVAATLTVLAMPLGLACAALRTPAPEAPMCTIDRIEDGRWAVVEHADGYGTEDRLAAPGEREGDRVACPGSDAWHGCDQPAGSAAKAECLAGFTTTEN